MVFDTHETHKFFQDVVLNLIDSATSRVDALTNQFDKNVREAVKEHLSNFYGTPTAEDVGPPFQIESFEHFKDLCKKFCYEFQNELRQSHISIHKSLDGLNVTEDSKMFIKLKINKYFENLLASRRSRSKVSI